MEYSGAKEERCRRLMLSTEVVFDNIDFSKLVEQMGADYESDSFRKLPRERRRVPFTKSEEHSFRRDRIGKDVSGGRGNTEKRPESPPGGP